MSSPPDLERKCRELIALYRQAVRPQVEGACQFGDLVSLDWEAEALSESLDAPTSLRVGFVGESQVGKSTLINAMIGHHALPSGGVGPLTASATRVAFSDRNAVEVKYHSRRKLNQLAFLIQNYLTRTGELRLAADFEDPDDTSELEAIQELDGIDTRALDSRSEEDESDPRSARAGQHLLSQARKLLDAEELAVSNVELLAGVRAILQHEFHAVGVDLGAFDPDIFEIARMKLGSEETLYEEDCKDSYEFENMLKCRAAGPLAPLVANLRLQLHHPLLEHATLIDLPGIGVVGDPAAKVAEEFVRQDGDLLIIVMRNNGMPDTVARLLEQTGVLTRLLFAGDKAAESIKVAIVVTHLDSVAKDRWIQERRKARQRREVVVPEKVEVFRDLAEDMAETVRRQVRVALQQSEAFHDLSEDLAQRRQSAVEELCRSLQVVCTSAADFLALQDGFEDEAFLKDEEDTGIPEIVELVNARVAETEEQRERKLRKHLVRFANKLDEVLLDLQDEAEAAEDQVYEDERRFRARVADLGERLGRRMQAYHGEVSEALRSTFIERLEVVCHRAREVVQRRHVALLKSARKLYWSSLNAALSRSGTWESKNVNFPTNLTRAFVDALASQWQTSIVDELIERMRLLADRDSALLQELADEVSQEEPAVVERARLPAQIRRMKQRAEECIEWTEDKLDTFRDQVQGELFEVIMQEISAVCEAAIADRQNYGTGAKSRILETFQTAGSEAIDTARVKSLSVLKKHYSALQFAIQETYLVPHNDPVGEAVKALTNEDAMKARDPDEARRREIGQLREQVEALLARDLMGEQVA